ncbi:MAG: hypothetical protein OXG38_00065 [Chloroflexi bacterium]|nr:hypothetical protein [Chloroflexota bacterium]
MISFLQRNRHTPEQAQAVVEVVQESQDDLVTKSDLTAALDLIEARLQNWMLKLVVAQTALFVTIAVGAIVVAGVLWG